MTAPNPRIKWAPPVSRKQIRRLYETVENFRASQQRGTASHMADLSQTQADKSDQQGIFGSEQFVYDPQTDTYRCPAGQTLTRREQKRQRQAYEYACAAATCQACPLRPQRTCAKKPTARTIKRHYDQEAIDAVKEQSHSPAAKRDRRRRKWRIEGSSGDAATRYGSKRARWWRLWRQQIQDLLIATVQNLRTLVRFAAAPVREAGVVSASVRILARAGIATVLGRWASRFAFCASSYQLDISDPTPGGSGAEADHLVGTSPADRQAAGGAVLQGNTQAGPEIQPRRPT